MRHAIGALPGTRATLAAIPRRLSSSTRQGRGWLSLFSLVYGLQSLALTFSALAHHTAPSHSVEPLIDLRIFYAAARLAAQGGNPYNVRALVAMEHSLFPTYSALAGQRGLLLPYMHGPLPLLTLRLFPRWDATLVVVVVLSLVALLILSCLLLMMTWPGQGRLAFLGVIIGLPPVIEEVGLGQLSSVVLLGICGGLFLARRRQVSAAVALAIVTASVKPHLGILALCAVGSTIQWRMDRRVWLGLLGGLTLMVVASLGTTDWIGEGEWLVAPLQFGQKGLASQIDLLTIPSNLGHIPPPVAHLSTIVIVSSWGAAMIWLWQRWHFHRPHVAREAWLALCCVGWLVCAPYGHTPDLILTLPALWYLWRQADHSRTDLLLLILGYAALWSTAWLHILAPYGTLVGHWIGLPCALIFCLVVILSTHHEKERADDPV